MALVHWKMYQFADNWLRKMIFNNFYYTIILQFVSLQIVIKYRYENTFDPIAAALQRYFSVY
jgi:hypothetical protein